jgi:hypothetical protein
LFVSSAVAQGWFGYEERPEVVLAGNSVRSWTLVNKKTNIASSNSCLSETTYRFFLNGDLVEQERCGAKTPSISHHRWMIVSKTQYDVTIKIDKTTYDLLIKVKTDRTQITLRNRSDSLIFPTTEEVFVLSNWTGND